jgi:hypothetical protein
MLKIYSFPDRAEVEAFIGFYSKKNFFRRCKLLRTVEGRIIYEGTKEPWFRPNNPNDSLELLEGEDHAGWCYRVNH